MAGGVLNNQAHHQNLHYLQQQCFAILYGGLILSPLITVLHDNLGGVSVFLFESNCSIALLYSQLDIATNENDEASIWKALCKTTADIKYRQIARTQDSEMSNQRNQT